MLLKIVQASSQKKSEEAYKNYLKYVSIVSIILGLLGIPVALSAKLSSFGSGMLLGMIVVLLLLGIYFLLVIRQPKRLHRMYINAYDERNGKILMVTAVATLALLFLLFAVLIALFAFAGIELAYPTLLILLLYSLVLGFAILRLVFSTLL